MKKHMGSKIVKICDICGTDKEVQRFLVGRDPRKLAVDLCDPHMQSTSYGEVLTLAERIAAKVAPRATMVLLEDDDEGAGAPVSPQKRVGGARTPTGRRTARRGASGAS